MDISSLPQLVLNGNNDDTIIIDAYIAKYNNPAIYTDFCFRLIIFGYHKIDYTDGKGMEIIDFSSRICPWCRKGPEPINENEKYFVEKTCLDKLIPSSKKIRLIACGVCGR